MALISNSAGLVGLTTFYIVACTGHAPASRPAPAPAVADSLPAPAPAAAPDTSASTWLTVDSLGRTATLDFEITSGGTSGLINGYRAGEARIIVPLGWTVRWSWRNADSGPPHSLVVMVQREKIPLEGGRAAFSNAMTRMVTEGLSPGQTDQTNFVADEAGWFWMLCGVPGHALEGEWIELRVDPQAKTASVELKSVNGKR
jgi:sulfocyanin SoxE-like protein